MDELLSVKSLFAYYETPTGVVRAVDGVDLRVDKNESFGICGESGCGKSTLALAILKLLKYPGYIKSGEILFENIDIIKLDEKSLKEIRWKKISYIPQSSMNALNPVKRIFDQFFDVIKDHTNGSVRKSEVKQQVKGLLESVGLSPEVANMYPCELSGGMKQRVIIAMSIALTPLLIIADEPTTALDVIVQRGIIQLLQDIKNKLKNSLILISHDMAVQAQISDKIAVMYAGKIVEIGKSNEIFHRPLHPYTRALISAVPLIKSDKIIRGIPGKPPSLKNPPSGCRFHPRCPESLQGKCDVEDPPLIEINDDRVVACHLYV